MKGYRVSAEKKCKEHVAEQEKMKVRKVGLGSNQESKKVVKKKGGRQKNILLARFGLWRIFAKNLNL